MDYIFVALHFIQVAMNTFLGKIKNRQWTLWIANIVYFQPLILLGFLEFTSLCSFFYSNCYSNSHTNHRVVSYWCGICHTVLYYAFLCLILTKIHSIHKWFVPFYVILCTYVFFHDLPTVGKMWATVNFYVSQIFIHD